MWKLVVNNFDYAIIPLVLTELVLGIARGDNAHFERNRAALKVLYPTHKNRFLAMPGHFVLQTVLGRGPDGGLPNPATFRTEARVATRASSKDDLVAGRVPMPESRKYSRGMDLDFLSSQMEKGKRQHVTTLEQLRQGLLAAPPATEWVRLWMHSLGVEATAQECGSVAAALDAAYQYECFLWDEAAGGRYDFSKHVSDWIDSQLLYYLSDASMHLLVHDSGLRRRIAGSAQSDRVFDYTHFARLATTTDRGGVPPAPRPVAAGHP